MRFTDFHSSGPVCSPTRAGLLTGRYQQRAGIPGVVYAAFNRNRHHGLQHKETTFAEILKKAGYATGLFGKWHLGYQSQYNPVHQGFDRYVGYVSGNVDFHTHIDGAGVEDWWHQDEKVEEKGYTTHLITRHAVKFIEDQKENPFCIYVAHEAPHDPYQGPNDPPVRHVGTKGYLFDHREPEHAARAYRDMMVEMDRGVGEIMAKLKELDLDEDTFVMFFSDNGATGPGSCGRLFGMKGTVWEGGIRVPGIARWPGRIKAGSVTDQLATTIDVLPTILDVADVRVPEGLKLDGESLLPLMEGKAESKPRKIFWQYGEATAMRDGEWKLVLNEGTKAKKSDRFPNIHWDHPDDGRQKLALFDLSKDVEEQLNLADKMPKRVKNMTQAIKRWEKEVMEGATEQPEKQP